MNVFEYAKQMELDGIAYYRREAELTKHPGFRKILELLINAERKHYAFFDSLQKGSVPEELLEFPEDEVKNVFRKMLQDKENFDFSAEQVEIYRKAREIEERSEKFYRVEAEKKENTKVKAQLRRIADEEARHALIVDGMVEYINRPDSWVEHAMFSWVGREY
ncbi:MAG: ferritin family protein [Victivallaceae bacterium]|nr:ferritin family protein [Victivallaceae bacterium]